MQFQTNGKLEGAELSAFAGSDAFRWMHGDSTPPSGTKSRWHPSIFVRIGFGLVLALVLGYLAFLLSRSHLW